MAVMQSERRPAQSQTNPPSGASPAASAADASSGRRVPQHVAIIMDGNGRWAARRGQPRLFGHRAGTNNLRRVLEAAVQAGVKIVTIYAFSTENWDRSKEEVSGLLRILGEALAREAPRLHKNGVQIRHLGSLRGVPDGLAKRIGDALELTKHNQRLTLQVAFNYGGRAEIVEAVRRIIADGVPAQDVDEDLFSRYLYTAGLPDPDLVIRTAGEMRLSNFLLWQASYSEYYSTPTFWPDFDEHELQHALDAYASRDRRFGGRPGRPGQIAATTPQPKQSTPSDVPRTSLSLPL